MASITVEIVSKTTSEAGTTFVLSASEEEIKRAGFVPYFVSPYFQGSLHDVNDNTVSPYFQGSLHDVNDNTVSPYFQGSLHDVNDNTLVAVSPYGSVAIAPKVETFEVYILPFVPALTEVDVNMEWFVKNAWAPYKLVKTEIKPNGTYQFNTMTPSTNVGDTLVFYDTKPADPA